MPGLAFFLFFAVFNIVLQLLFYIHKAGKIIYEQKLDQVYYCTGEMYFSGIILLHKMQEATSMSA